MTRPQHIDRLYALLDALRAHHGGYRHLRDCTGGMGWPNRGVYFFFEPGETRSKGGLRIVRVGTHALTSRSRTSLWDRLAQHRGSVGGEFPGGGNHRGSIFRLHVGAALLSRQTYPTGTGASWGSGSSASREIRLREHPLERDVSEYIRAMPFLWVAVPDEPGPSSARALIEANCISLLSNRGRPALDPPSPNWLGHSADRAEIRESGLWNVNHVDDEFDPRALDVLERLVEAHATGIRSRRPR